MRSNDEVNSPVLQLTPKAQAILDAIAKSSRRRQRQDLSQEQAAIALLFFISLTEDLSRCGETFYIAAVEAKRIRDWLNKREVQTKWDLKMLGVITSVLTKLSTNERIWDDELICTLPFFISLTQKLAFCGERFKMAMHETIFITHSLYDVAGKYMSAENRDKLSDMLRMVRMAEKG